MSTDTKNLRTLLEVNRLEGVEELREVLEVISKGIQKAREEAKPKKAEKKMWRKKVNAEESKLMSKVMTASANDAEKVDTANKGDSKLLSKVLGSVNDIEKGLQKLSDIGFKPTLTSKNNVASESYTLLQQALKGIGNLHYAAIGLSMVAYVLERVNVVRDNSGKCLALLERMYKLGRDMVNAYGYLPENGDLLQSTLTEITKGVYFCCKYTESGVVSRFGFATVNKDEFDTLKKTMKDLSQQFLRASQVAVLKGQMSVQECQTSLSNQITELSKRFETVAIQENDMCPPVDLLKDQMPIGKNMKECEMHGNVGVASLECGHTTNTSYGLPEVSDRDTESSNVVLGGRSSVSKPEEERVDIQTSQERARPENLQRLPKHMTDMHFEEEKIVSKLETVRTLGLVGMGGLGKTTLAKSVFNILGPKFDYSCFITDVKLLRGREEDVKDELWKCLHFEGRKVEGERNLSRLRGKRLLLALDDVSDRDIKVLLDLVEDTDPASRFIWTSRQRDILKDEGEIYEVPFLSESHAKLLFMKHAFPEAKTLSGELESLVRAVVRQCDGLPLAVEVLGKHLWGKEKEVFWKATLAALERAEKVKNLGERLSAKLRVTFESLTEKEKEIFLDATNFFSGNGSLALGDAKMLWRAAYGEVSELLWRTLVDMSLVYDVGEHDTVRMHEQLRCVGRMIASESNVKYEVWKCKANGEVGLPETSDALHGKDVRALRVVPDGDALPVHISSTRFENLRRLRFLDIDESVQILGEVNDATLPTQLVLLRCAGQALFNPALQKDLAIVTLSGMKCVPSSIGQLSKLQYLRMLSFGKRCHSIPDSFGNLSCLTIFHLECRELLNLPESFGCLKALQTLDIACFALRRLPESFGHLQALQTLKISSYALRSLPESFGQLNALKELNFICCPKLQNLPESFGQLNALKHLHFFSCPELQCLPESFGHLRALEHLEIQISSVGHLPESFGQLSALKYLRIKKCRNLKLLPQSFGQLSRLESLSFERCGLESLPESFGQLSALYDLSFKYCNVESLPESFGQLSALKFLTLEICSLPASFGQLTNLITLRVNSPPGGLPRTMANLVNLKFLILWNCTDIAIPDFIKSLPSLESVDIFSTKRLVERPEIIYF